MKKVLIIALPLVLILIFMITAFYYLSSLATLNKIVQFANRAVDAEFSDGELISLEDYNKLIGIHYTGDEYIVNGGTLYFPKKLGLDTISFSCKSDYSVVVFDTNEQVEKVSDRKFVVEMRFKKWKWVISSVEVKEDV